MKYMLLIFGDESADEGMTGEQLGAMLAEYQVYTESLMAAGAFVHAEALQPTATATCVRVPAGEALTTHGPFAETKEQLGGYYMIDVANLDEAIAWAAKCPGAKDGQVEIRPIMTFD